ncbi:MAG: hypothetical protein V1775_15245 [Bacteroidota bacterium]
MKKLSSRINSALAIGAFATMALLSGCEYDYVEPDNTPLPTEVSFATDIMPVFNASCNMAGCHATGAAEPDLTPANAYSSLQDGGYINTNDPASSLIYTAMATGSMKSYSTTSQVNLILAWIQKGALNN